jgi:outer membrane protein TolC
MRDKHSAVMSAAAFLLAACQSYQPEPVDLVAHADAFAARLPGAGSVRDYVEALRQRLPAAPAYDPSDGIGLHEAQLLALLFNPGLRTARLRAGVAAANRDYAGLWQDPVLGADFAKILEDVPHPWVVAGQIAFTIPITGGPGLARDLADAKLALAWTEARAAESQVLAELDRRLVEWAVAQEQTRVLRDVIERVRQLETTAQRLAAAQQITNLEARTFTLERVGRETELLRQQASARDKELALKQVLGLAPAAEVTFQGELTVELRVADAAARATALRDGPRLALRAHEHAVSERGLALAIRKQWPDLTLAPGYQEEDGEPRAALGFSLPLPLWNRNRREIAEARAERAAAAERLRAELELNLQDLARAELLLQSARDQRRQLEQQLVPLVEQQLADGRRLVELGRLDVLLLLDGLLRSFAAKNSVLEAALAEARAAAQVNSYFWPSLSTTHATEKPR